MLRGPHGLERLGTLLLGLGGVKFGKIEDVSLLLHRRDGVVRARCRDCGDLCDVPPGSNGEAFCGKCVNRSEAFEYRGDRKKDAANFRMLIREAQRLVANGRMA